MASRKSRSRRQSAAASRTRRAAGSPSERAAGAPVVDTEAPAVSPAKSSVDWSSEYQYVVADLRQLLLVSVALFAVMVAVGYFI